jgi:hypothetical protein
MTWKTNCASRAAIPGGHESKVPKRVAFAFLLFLNQQHSLSRQSNAPPAALPRLSSWFTSPHTRSVFLIGRLPMRGRNK